MKNNFSITGTYLYYLLFCTCGLLTSQCQASGFRISELSVAGTATSNAMVANNEITGALAYNPAAMSFHENMVFVGGLKYATYKLSVTPTGGSKTNHSGKDSFLIPDIFIMNPFENKLSLGMAINTPFGLETNWPDNTFPAFAGNNLLELSLTKIEVINYNPNIAWQIDENLSFALGIDYYDVTQANLNSQAVSISGSGQHHGWNIGFMLDAGDLDFGFTYHSPVNIQLDGYLNSTPVTSAIELPSIMQAGLRYKLNKQLAIELDFDRTGWSSLQAIIVRSKANGAALTSSTHNWQNANAWRLGASYELDQHNQLRAGFCLDKTPQKERASFSARTPDADRQTYSLGLAHRMDGWLIEASYMYVLLEDTTVNSSKSYTPGQDPNGTSAYNGSYQASGQILGLGINKRF